MNSDDYFFDTYAFFEIIRGNPSYVRYKQVKFVTSIFNIAELNYNLKKLKGKEIADAYIDKLKDQIVTVDLEDIKKAMDIKNKRRGLSIPDVVGYVVALKYRLKFLTGDEDFMDMPNVEFVK